MVPTNPLQERPLQERRRLLRDKAECRIVDSDEFCKLMLGFRKLVRADDSALQMRGLLDVETGIRFLIEQEKLTPPEPQLH